MAAFILSLILSDVTRLLFAVYLLIPSPDHLIEGSGFSAFSKCRGHYVNNVSRYVNSSIIEKHCNNS